MLGTLASGLASGIVGEGSVIANALLESFTIHARALQEFLYAERAQPDDVIAEDFFVSPNVWRDARSEPPSVLEWVRRRVGKEVAHLTYARLVVTPEEKPWPFLEIAQAYDAAVQKFIGLVPRNLLGPRWSRSLDSPRMESKNSSKG